MNREDIAKAIDDISDDYKLEALGLDDEGTDRKPIVLKKRFVSIAAAACLIFALGITAYAIRAFEISKRTADPDETISVDYEIDGGPEDPAENVTVTYKDLSTILSFSGPGSCNEIEFKATNVSEDYHFSDEDVFFGDPDGWNDFLQGTNDTGCFNIEVYYSSRFGPDGHLFLDDIITDESETQEGDYHIIRLSGTSRQDEECHNHYVMKYDTETGCLIIVSGTVSMEECERIMSGLEIRETGRSVDYVENEQHDIYMCTGVG